MTEYVDRPNLGFVKEAYERSLADRLPDDEYEMRVKDCGFFPDQGKDWFQIEWKVDSGEYKGSDRIDKFEIDERWMWKFARAAKALWPDNYENLEWIEKNHQVIIGEIFKVELRTEEAKTGKKYQNTYILARLEPRQEQRRRPVPREERTPF